MLAGIIALYYLHGSATLDYTFDIATITNDVSAQALILDPATQSWLFWAFALAFLIKVPLFPFHTWLPDAHVEAPTAGSVLLAGVLLKMGTYGLMRFNLPLFPDASRQLRRVDLLARSHRNHLRRAGRDGPARLEEARRLFVREPSWVLSCWGSFLLPNKECRARCIRC